jgi:hypothetical protein
VNVRHPARDVHGRTLRRLGHAKTRQTVRQLHDRMKQKAGQGLSP